MTITFRRTLVLGAIALIVIDMAGILVIQPVMSFTISLSEVYEAMSLGTSLVFLGIAALFSLGVAAIAALLAHNSAYIHPSRMRMIWSRLNGCGAVVGGILTIFAIVGLAFAFGYLTLDDRYPEGFTHAPFWVLIVNAVGGPALLALAAISTGALEIVSRVRRAQSLPASGL